MLSRNLNDRQREAITHWGGPLLIAAGAGSGKTKTLTGRVIHFLSEGVDPGSLIAITFTNKAAKEMAQRITHDLRLTTNDHGPKEGGGGVVSSKLSAPTPGSEPRQYAGIVSLPFIGTFHSLGARILKNECAFFGRTPAYTIFDSDDSAKILRQTIKDLGIKRGPAGGRAGPVRGREGTQRAPTSNGAGGYGPAIFGRAVSKIKNELISADELRSGEAELDAAIAEIFTGYELRLKNNNAFDFDDLIEKPARLFRKEPEVLARYRKKFQYIFVDEFQDTNPAQYEFIKLLAGEHRNISVVGDDQQSIYSFRGSDFRNFLNFEKDWLGSKVVLLEENYRSTGNIIGAASAVIAHNVHQKKKNLWTKEGAGAPVKIFERASDEDEAEWLAQEVLEKIRSTPVGGQAPLEVARARSAPLPLTGQAGMKDLAILYRTNAQSRAIEQSLILRNIPYQISGGIRFYERKEIKDLVACLRYAQNPLDSPSAARIRENFLKKQSAGLLTRLPEISGSLSPIELIGFVLKSTEYLDYLKRNYPNAEERIENVRELIRFAGEHSNLSATPNDARQTGLPTPGVARQAGLSEFLEKITLLEAADVAKNSGPKKDTAKPRVHLMTIHIAKGLEFDTVFVVGVSEGILPHQMSYLPAPRVARQARGGKENRDGLAHGVIASDEPAIVRGGGVEEERRLMYVAMTRARQELYLSFYDVGSRFLYEIPPELVEFTGASGKRGEEWVDDEERYITYD